MFIDTAMLTADRNDSVGPCDWILPLCPFACAHDARLGKPEARGSHSGQCVVPMVTARLPQPQPLKKHGRRQSAYAHVGPCERDAVRRLNSGPALRFRRTLLPHSDGLLSRVLLPRGVAVMLLLMRVNLSLGRRRELVLPILTKLFLG